MYEYSPFDKAFLKARNTQFRAQVARRLNGELSEEAFKPLRLLNGLYYQLHAYMLRVAIPYGTLNSQQMHMLAHISEKWDRGFGHFTTRQNIQFNWPELSDVPDMLDALETVGMHSVQTSGNTIRNVTADHFAGAAADEIEDPRPIAELLRQWSTDHPEFQFLPRKFKIAITGSVADRAVIRAHDIGLRIVQNSTGARGFEVTIGGGLGRTPMIGKRLKSFLPKADLLPYLEAVVATYNLLGRRDNKYKARIKITVHEHGIDKIRTLVEQKFTQIRPDYPPLVPQILTDIQAHFAPPDFKHSNTERFILNRSVDPVFCAWCDTNLHPHKQADHAIVTISLKPHGGTPGDATADQMHLIADLARRYSYDEIRISHEQNIILPHVQKNDLPQLHAALLSAGLATANIGLTSDIIACPGMDFCALATAHSIPVAQQISNRIRDLKIEHDVGPLKIKISGCINACGHHHLGHIGILGLERAGVENYQITLGGDATTDTRIGTRTGPGFAADKIVPAIERLILGYLDLRNTADETFIQCYRRVGIAPFKEILYPQEAAKNAA
ncbi:nitrite/sulfite reductase [Profundibacter sp.]